MAGEGTDYAADINALLHRFVMEANGDLLWCVTADGLLRMPCLGVA